MIFGKVSQLVSKLTLAEKFSENHEVLRETKFTLRVANLDQTLIPFKTATLGLEKFS